MERLIGIHETIGGELQGFGGLLRCEHCGVTSDLGWVGGRLKYGWPQHCGFTMRWWTQRQVDADEVPRVGGPVLRSDVDTILATAYTPAGMASWWTRPRHQLDGRTPDEVWPRDPQRVLRLAKGMNS